MKSAILIFGSVTKSMKAQSILAAQNWQARVERLQRGSVRGCGYGVRVYGDLRTACNLLEEAGMPCVDIQWY